MNITYMRTAPEQMKGLMFVKDMPFDLAVVFPFSRKKHVVVHTWFCKFALDIGMLNEEDRITKLYENVQPFKIIPMQACNGFVETRTGAKMLTKLMRVPSETDKDAEDWTWRK